METAANGRFMRSLSAATTCITRFCAGSLKNRVAKGGIEPPTQGFSDRLAMLPYCFNMLLWRTMYSV